MNTDKEEIEIVEQAGKTGADSADPSQAPGATAEPGQTELQQMKAKADENWERYLRLAADFDNFKKRAARERQEAIKFANESLLEKLVAVMDHFDMALAASTGAPANQSDSFRAGVAMIHQQLKAVLSEGGLTEIDAANQTFDPNWHQAVSSQETTEIPENQVVQQLRKGYKLRDRLLRPASVVVAKKPA
jgi:molecular chaperone GrpE